MHEGLSRREARKRSVERLRSVRIGSPERRARNYPHELSGGMRQRAMIAMGLMGTPQLIIADEPTTALDVTVQQQILKLLDDIGTSTGAAAILISHDIAVVSQLCQRVLVMYAGRVVEELDVPTLVRQTRPSLHGGPAGVGPDDGVRPGAAVGLDSRASGRPVRPFARLPVRTPLPRGVGSLPRRASGARSRWRAVTGSPAGTRTRSCRTKDPPGATSPCGKTHSRDRARDPCSDRPFRARALGTGRGRRRRPRRAGAVDRRSRRGVRLGQVHPRARRSSGLVPIAGGRGAARRRSRSRHRAHRLRRRAEARGVQMVFQDPFSSLNPAHDGRRGDRRGRRRRAARVACGARQRGRAATRARPPRPGRRARAARPPLRRAAAAGGTRACARGAPGGADRRRDHLGARRLGAERHPEPDARSARPARHLDPLRLAQPRDRPLRQRPLAVMYLGRLVEVRAGGSARGPSRNIPTRRSLLAAVPRLGVSIRDVGTSTLDAVEPPDPRHPPSGCHLHPRCPVGPMVDPSGRSASRATRAKARTRGLHRAACHFAPMAPSIDGTARFEPTEKEAR